jgi:hypothetical protein
MIYQIDKEKDCEGADYFSTYKYNPDFYQKVEQNYLEDKSYQIVEWEWKRGGGREITNTINCPILSDFNRELWDLFAVFARENTVQSIWGPFGLENRNPEKPETVYFDGIVFHYIKNELIACSQENTVSRMMSLLVHYKYFNITFVTLDKEGNRIEELTTNGQLAETSIYG